MVVRWMKTISSKSSEEDGSVSHAQSTVGVVGLAGIYILFNWLKTGLSACSWLFEDSSTEKIHICKYSI